MFLFVTLVSYVVVVVVVVSCLAAWYLRTTLVVAVVGAVITIQSIRVHSLFVQSNHTCNILLLLRTLSRYYNKMNGTQQQRQLFY